MEPDIIKTDRENELEDRPQDLEYSVKDKETRIKVLEYQLKEAKARGKVYVSGPITGREREAVLYAFNDVRCYLEIMGFEVVLPIENGLPADASHAAHMKADFGLLLGCDYIYLLEGWMESHGCVAEMFVAKSAGIKVLHNEEERKYKYVNVSLNINMPIPPGVLSDVLGVNSVKFEEVPAEDECEDDTEE